MVRIQYIGHSTLLIESDVRAIIDPYLKGKGREGLSRHNPNAALSVEDVEEIGLDFILLTHGHGDHFGQTFELLERTEAKLVASNRVCDFVAKKTGESRLLRIEPGERLEIDETTVFALKAMHKYGLEEFVGDILGMLAYERYTPCGTNMGFLISAEGRKIYHSGDTHIVKGVHDLDVAFLSMDGFRTLNEKESIEAIREINVGIVVPIHYRWLGKGRDTVEKVGRMIKYEAVDTLFREMAYVEVMLL